jgi:NTP pyrophosphatase (non-canonical NTP hydrolase)
MGSAVRQRILHAIEVERDRQDRLYGESNSKRDPLDYAFIAVLAEEVGEASQALQYARGRRKETGEPASIHESLAEYESELVQAAAVCVQILERIAQYRKENDIYG